MPNQAVNSRAFEGRGGHTMEYISSFFFERESFPREFYDTS